MLCVCETLWGTVVVCVKIGVTLFKLKKNYEPWLARFFGGFAKSLDTLLAVALQPDNETLCNLAQSIRANLQILYVVSDFQTASGNLSPQT